MHVSVTCNVYSFEKNKALEQKSPCFNGFSVFVEKYYDQQINIRLWSSLLQF